VPQAPCLKDYCAYRIKANFLATQHDQFKLALYCIGYDLRVTDETGDRVPNAELARHAHEGTKKIRTMERPARPGVPAHTVYFLEAV
jgi:hypothetical protein